MWGRAGVWVCEREKEGKGEKWGLTCDDTKTCSGPTMAKKPIYTVISSLPLRTEDGS